MQNLKIVQNTIQSHGSTYSNYIYTFNYIDENSESDPLQLLPYQIETNEAYEDYLSGQFDVLEKFKNALALEENYMTIMNVCVISLALRNFEELNLWTNKAIIYSKGQTHHIILLAEMHLIIHDYDNALKQLIQLFINKEQEDVVQNLLGQVFKRKLYSLEHFNIFVQDLSIIEELTKINKQCFIQYHSQNSFQTQRPQILNLSKQQSQLLDMLRQSSFNEEINTQSYQTQQTDQISLITLTQEEADNFNQQQLLDFSFIDIILDNPNLFSFQLRIPYMIGSYDIKNINKLPSKIAEGGFGEVYVAKHLTTNEIHALKIIKQQEDQKVNLILQETIIQDKIQKLNPQLFLNLKPLIYLKKNSKLVDIYIPLELGQFSLYEYIQEHQINDQEYNQFQNLFIDYIVTLHSNKYAHRDIKPQNILFIKDVGWKLADFGESQLYDKVEDIYKIRGTFAFLPQKLRQQIKQNQQVKQNLLQNDLYAVVCTLIMIKNPNFTSKELTDYMDKNLLDQQLQEILNHFDNLDQLNKLKVCQEQQIYTKILIKKQIQDQEFQWNCYEKLTFYKEQYQALDNDFIQQLDKLLAQFKHEKKQHNQIYLSLIISQSFPFQIEQFQNLLIFNFQRHLLADFQSLNNIKQSQYYSTIIDYFLTIKLYDFAIRVCDSLISLEYTLIFHLQKVNALMCLDKSKQAKEELELVYRYFLSTQSYNLNEQILFFHLYQRLHKQVPQIRVDERLKNALINNLNKIKTNYHEIDVEINTPINFENVIEQQHLKLRLDVIFDFIRQDPYNINIQVCFETANLFGNHFIQDGQLQNCEQLIKLIKENLIFWSNHYITKILIIGIGLNYLFVYFGKHWVALDIGLYFHKILKNIGSCESILAHYEHLLNTQLIIFKQYNQKPVCYLDFNKCLLEVSKLSLFDQIYFNLKSMIIWYIQEISINQTLLQQKVFEEFKLQIRLQLSSLKNILHKETNSSQQNKLRQLLQYMIINFLSSISCNLVLILQVVKKIFGFLVYLNQEKRVFIGLYNEALKITKQYRMNIKLIKQQLAYLIQIKKLPLMEKFMYTNFIVIIISPVKVLNILNMYGLNKKKCLLASLEYNLNNDLRHFLYCHQDLSKTIISKKIRQKIDIINLHYQYFNV